MALAVSSAGTCCLLLRSRLRFLREVELGHEERGAAESAGAVVFAPPASSIFPAPGRGWSKSVTPGETLGERHWPAGGGGHQLRNPLTGAKWVTSAKLLVHFSPSRSVVFTKFGNHLRMFSAIGIPCQNFTGSVLILIKSRVHEQQTAPFNQRKQPISFKWQAFYPPDMLRMFGKL